MKSKWTLEEVEKTNSSEITEPIIENEERPLKIEYIEPESIKNSREIIEKAYFDSSNNYPWIIGYSGGKDSTFLLQLVIDTLLKGKSNSSQLKRKVCIVCSNTKVENPIVDQRNELIRKLFSKWLVKEKLMDVFSFTFVEAIPSESFWVNLIGRGYPAPNQTFRWCTHRLKIKPMSEMVDKLLEKYKKVITVLGLRYEESKSRERSMKKHESDDGIYSRSTHSKDTFVFSPIRHIKLMEIWKHLMKTPPPWDFGKQLNNHLSELYQESSLYSGNMEQCGFSLDGNIQKSCGSSRWGCWTCTVVSQDKAIDSFIWNNRDYLKPLADFRNSLSKERDERKNRYSGSLRINKKTNSIAKVPVRLMKLKNIVQENNKEILITINKKESRPKINYLVSLEKNKQIKEKIALELKKYSLSLDNLENEVYLVSFNESNTTLCFSHHDYARLVSLRKINAYSEAGASEIFIYKLNNEAKQLSENINFFVNGTSCYTLTYRKTLLNRLLNIQNNSEMKLISKQEVLIIKKIWKQVKNRLSEGG